ncbi:hypothetical protein GGE46_004513 [Rhizobium etli]|uniref:Uncharacterized protein n=1 Tax=Rhizobium etli TaxID=29449 RepID=A0A7W6VCY4_RHIET|nr:hypothetical protein [Rhizobium etli]MBB4537740.1 hypothetical protein [Rhizobium etli]
MGSFPWRLARVAAGWGTVARRRVKVAFSLHESKTYPLVSKALG